MLETSSVFVGHLTGMAPGARKPRFTTKSDENTLITVKLHVQGRERPLNALVDSGASNNFIRASTLGTIPSKRCEEKHVASPSIMKVRLATGAVVELNRRVVRMHYAIEELQLDDEFIVLNLDDKFDVILGMPWLVRYQPSVDWLSRSITLAAPKDAPAQDHGEQHPPTGGSPPWAIQPTIGTSTDRISK